MRIVGKLHNVIKVCGVCQALYYVHIPASLHLSKACVIVQAVMQVTHVLLHTWLELFLHSSKAYVITQAGKQLCPHSYIFMFVKSICHSTSGDISDACHWNWTRLIMYCLCLRHALWWKLKGKRKIKLKGKRKMKQHTCDALMWAAIACVWGIRFDENWKERWKTSWKGKGRWNRTSVNIALEIRKGKSINCAVKDHRIPMTTLFYINEGKFTKQQMGPAPELKEYKPFLVSWIRKCKKLWLDH